MRSRISLIARRVAGAAAGMAVASRRGIRAARPQNAPATAAGLSAIRAFGWRREGLRRPSRAAGFPPALPPRFDERRVRAKAQAVPSMGCGAMAAGAIRRGADAAPKSPSIMASRSTT